MSLFSSSKSLLQSFNFLPQSNLSEDDRRMYESEELDNFRWIVAGLRGKQSGYKLMDSALVSGEIHDEVAELGQFSEVVYSSVAVDTLVNNSQTLFRNKYPLEHLNALRGCQLIAACRGAVADIRAYIFLRKVPGEAGSEKKQLVVSMPGTSTLKQALYDILAMKTQHPSGEGNIHRGFWSLYMGIKDDLLLLIRQGIANHSPDQLVLTGHSMGGSLAYLLLMDLLSEEVQPEESQLTKLKVIIVAFGAPRSGDASLVDHFHKLVDQFGSKHSLGRDFLTEYSVQGYNDGVPTMPPRSLGYVHFCKSPLYTVGGKLYRTSPAMEGKHDVFQVEDSPNNKIIFPKGGHNYYNGRNLELFRRQTGWLVVAGFPGKDWEGQYIQLANIRDGTPSSQTTGPPTTMGDAGPHAQSPGSTK